MNIAAIFLAILAFTAFLAIIEIIVFFYCNEDEKHQPSQKWKDPYDLN